MTCEVTALGHEDHLADETPRPLRADAARNRLRILQAAEDVFAEQGVSVPIDAVAEAAGVGVGTVYRHFPTKESLFEAIVITRLEELLVRTRELEEAADAGEAFAELARYFSRQLRLKHDLFDAMMAAGFDVKSGCAEAVAELEQRFDAMRQRAVAAQAIRSDVATEQILGLLIGSCRGAQEAGLSEQSTDQMIRIILDGLRAGA